MRRARLVATTALLAATVVGCGASGGDVKADGTTTAPSDRTTTTTAPPPIDGLEPDQVVWQESSGGGMVPVEVSVGEVPLVTIYGDGRILVRVVDPDASYLHPAVLEQNQVAAPDLEAFVAEAQASGLFDPGVDFGQPGVTDMPTTSVLLAGGGRPASVSVYALSFAEPSSEGGGPFGLSPEQAAKRTALTALLVKARELGANGEEYVPDQVRATMLGSAARGDPADGAAARWPGPAFDQFPAGADEYAQSCLVIEGADAAAVYQAAARNEGTTWTDGTVERKIVVAPMVPGQEGCPPA